MRIRLRELPAFRRESCHSPRYKKEIGRIELQIMGFENFLQFCDIQFLCNGIGYGAMDEK